MANGLTIVYLHIMNYVRYYYEIRNFTGHYFTAVDKATMSPSKCSKQLVVFSVLSYCDSDQTPGPESISVISWLILSPLIQ